MEYALRVQRDGLRVVAIADIKQYPPCQHNKTMYIVRAQVRPFAVDEMFDSLSALEVPINRMKVMPNRRNGGFQWGGSPMRAAQLRTPIRSEEHTSELQSLRHLVCR